MIELWYLSSKEGRDDKKDMEEEGKGEKATSA